MGFINICMKGLMCREGHLRSGLHLPKGKKMESRESFFFNFAGYSGKFYFQTTEHLC